MKNNDWKDRLNVVYSTNPDFNYDMDDDQVLDFKRFTLKAE